MILYAILLKNRLRDENGLPNYIWATKSQIDKITKLRNSPDNRYNFIKINTHIFSPMDIAYIDEKETEDCGLPIPLYAIERYEKENGHRDKKGIPSGERLLSRKELLEQDSYL